MRYILSKMSVLGCFLSIIGAVFTIQGIIVRYNLTNIKDSYNQFEIKNGRYIEYDITKEYLLGRYYTNQDGSNQFSPYCNTDALSSNQFYLAAINKDFNYYVSLVIVRDHQKNFKKMLNSNEPYHIVGKFVKLRGILIYEGIAKCLGTDNKSKINQIVSMDHQIKIVNLESEKKILYKGLSILVVGVLIFISSLEIDRKCRMQNVDNL